MVYKRVIGALGALAVAGLGALALASPASAQQDDPAFEHGLPAITAAATEECGEVELTFTNPTPWLFVFDVRVDGEASLNASVAPGVVIAEGPLAGQEFGERWTLVEVDGRDDVHEVVQVFAFEESVEVRLAEGAEQKLFFDWLAIDVYGMACPEPSPSPTPEPEPTPTASPTEEAPAGPGGSDDDKHLALTGRGDLPLYLGGAAVLAGTGGGLLLLFRRRRQPTFSAE